MPRCSVIVVTYNSAAHIEACVRALEAQDCEIIVVDNASQDETLARLELISASIPMQVLSLTRNLGFAAGVNVGARAATADVLVVLNPDAVAEAGALDALIVCLTRSRAAAAGGALLRDDGRTAKGFAFRRLPTLASLLFEVLLVNQVWPSNPVNRRYRCLDADYAREQPVEQPAGACLAIQREVWESLRGMDPQFFPVWFEDVDLCARIGATGGKIVYCPSARFQHSGAHSVGQIDFRDRQSYWYASMLRYARKHLSIATVLVLRVGIVAGMLLRMLVSLIAGGPKGINRSVAIRAYWQVMRETVRGD
jgi:GT2 family glycosyltransferase